MDSLLIFEILKMENDENCNNLDICKIFKFSIYQPLESK